MKIAEQQRCSVTILTLLMVAQFMNVQGARVLVIPSAMTSHCRKMMSIGQELLNRGHEVTLLAIILDQKACLSVLNTHAFNKTFRVISPNLDPAFKATHDDILERMQIDVFSGTSWPYILKNYVNPMTTNLCSAVITSRSVLGRLEQDRYDIALVDGTPFYGCLISIPVHLGIPHVAESSLFNPVDVGMALQTNKVPIPLSGFSNEMCWTQRFMNTLLLFLEPILWRYVLSSHDMSNLSDKLKGVDTRDLIKESVMFLENTDFIVDYPMATFPNLVQVGGLTTTHAQPLPDDLRHMLDKASRGVILVTFGTVLNNFPKQLYDSVLKGLEMLNRDVILRTTQDKNQGNIKTMKWVPQNDILGHPNTKLFVSHCGKNSFWEAVYHAVPILCMTTNAETHMTAIKVRKYGIGSELSLLSTSATEISEAITHVLQNGTIRANMKKMSAMFRDRPEPPAQRAASAIEHVMKYGGSHLRAPDVSFVSYIYADVWLFIFVLSVTVLGTILHLIRKRLVDSISCKQKTE